jgi:methylated-DNA-[protein]-cysteine S-methyltransferase
MQGPIKYAIFPTKWGYFGLAATPKALLRTCLPGPGYEEITARLLNDLPAAQFDRTLFKPVQKRICAYFDAETTEFGPDIPLDLTGLTPFQAAVLTACRQLQFGRTTTYGQLAKKLGRPAAARAVANALARNPLPLIIPCHRVLCANGNLGGFSAPGGTELKARLLRHEQHIT